QLPHGDATQEAWLPALREIPLFERITGVCASAPLVSTDISPHQDPDPCVFLTKDLTTVEERLIQAVGSELREAQVYKHTPNSSDLGLRFDGLLCSEVTEKLISTGALERLGSSQVEEDRTHFASWLQYIRDNYKKYRPSSPRGAALRQHIV
ncbi:unnamed protein product, partial [Amoebophrya sp. A120]